MQEKEYVAIICMTLSTVQKKQDIQATSMKGICGTIESVDSLGQLHVKWDNGSSLALVPEKDKFTIFY